MRQQLQSQLHDRYAAGAYDNWVVWAGELSVQVGELTFDATLARAYADADHPTAMCARVELFFGAIEQEQIRGDDIEARLWSDAVGETGGYVPMLLDVDERGMPRLCEGNLVFQSSDVPLSRCGTYRYWVEFSADGLATNDPDKQWVHLNDLAQNQDGILVVSPIWVAGAPSMMEVCLRKLNAHIDEQGLFHSGHIQDLTAVVADLPVDVIYLLPFFRPGYRDSHTGEDVRKGKLGSPYAVADFFAIDPDLVPASDHVDLAQLLSDTLFDTTDIVETLGLADRTREQLLVSTPTPSQVADLGAVEVANTYGEDTLKQLVGRAHLRQLTRAAHAAGKRVIFDLVLMQTSRDNELIRLHPEWYVTEADGRPAIHRIAWLEYSDVALFDLAFNEPLQDYLLEIAPYWMERCDLDGVRIDASQTVDRPFLSRLHNRIHDVRADALVLGETLCPIEEAVDIPVDMIYALLVDFHRDAETATPLIDFLEQMHSSFAAGTVAKAYFENHDSPRATAVWQERYAQNLTANETAFQHWQQLLGDQQAQPTVGALAHHMALLKNLQASLIDATLGMAPATTMVELGQRARPSGGCQLAWALEWGSQWGECEATDFENPTLLRSAQAAEVPGNLLVAAYHALPEILEAMEELIHGRIYYHRQVSEGDHILAATRYTADAAIVVLHNLDPLSSHTAQLDMSWLTQAPVSAGRMSCPVVAYDSYDALTLASNRMPVLTLQGSIIRTSIEPLQSRLLRLDWVCPTAAP